MGRALVGKTIAGGEIFGPKLVSPLSPVQFFAQIGGKKIKAVDRRAKILIVTLSDGSHLTIHLKLTGQLIFKPKSDPLQLGGHPQSLPRGLSLRSPKYTRLILDFADGSRLFFNDLRKFGWLKIIAKEKLSGWLARLGWEPLSKNFTAQRFNQLLDRYPQRKIKLVLMDQSLIAGIGNIYADEICFAAKILPTRPAGNFSEKEKRALHRAIIKVLKLAISKKGASANNTYVQLDGSPGSFIPYLKVYGRAGKPCKRCGSPIKKIKQNGRGTHFCPRCQR